MTARLLTRALPDRLLTRIFPARYSWNPDDMKVARLPDAEVRLLVGPVNSAGQGHAWARAVERELRGVGATSLMTRDASTDRYGFDVDVAVPVMGFTFASEWQRLQRKEIEENATHVLLESGRFAYGSIPFRTPGQVAAALQKRGVRVALLWHGSDIRLPSRHAAVEPDSPFGPDGGYPAESIAILERNATGHRRLVEETDFPTFVSTPGLKDVPRSTWLPVVVDMTRWMCERPVLERDRPIVTYVPSNSPMKGAPSVDAELQELDAAGEIEYRRLAGIPSRDMPAVYRDADIVLDQFRLGDYGVAACEAMAAGRVVIGHVGEQVRSFVRRETGLELPIVESRLGEIATTIRKVLDDRVAFHAQAARGVEFVREVHDGRRSARVLAPFLGVPADVVGGPR